MNVKWGRIVVLIVMAASFLTSGQVFAGADDLAKQADKIIREAERTMFNGKNTEADALLSEASTLIDQGKAEDLNNKRILQVEKNLLRVQQNVDKKLGRTAKSFSSESNLPPQPQPKAMTSKASEPSVVATTASGGKLPGGVKKRLQDISGHLNNAERYASSDYRNAQYKLKQAAELFGEIEKSYGGQFDPKHPDFAAVQTRYVELSGKVAEQGAVEAESKIAATEGKVAMERQSAEWIAGFREYLSYPGQEGHNSAKLVFVPGTSEPEKFTDAQKRFAAFNAFYEAYKKTEFPDGKTWELEDLAENQAPLRLKDFTAEFASRVESVSGEAGTGIDAAMRQLEKDNEWRTDNKVKPNLVDHKWMMSIRESTQNVIAALGESDPKAKEIQLKFDTLVAKDKEHRQIRKERTFMTPDRYAGSDIDQLKKKAEELVEKNKKEGGEPLRCTITSENWQEQTVEEWADTSKTSWVRRTTRNITGQVAARTSDGVRLITVALAKDQQRDGSWGALYGNLHQDSDPMMESNVDK